MILEGIVTTLDGSGRLNVAPMGPRVEPDPGRLTLRPFVSSTTYRNLHATGEGVLHVTDDVLMLARAAIGRLDLDSLATRAATNVRGRILLGACRFLEFRVSGIDDRAERATIDVQVVAEGRLRDFFGLNRGKHAVVEAAILATRTHLLPRDAILDEYRRLRVLVTKTGGPAEFEAFELLQRFVEEQAARDEGSGQERGQITP